jgi:hypothetical protein
VTQKIAYLLCKHKALSLNPSLTKKKKEIKKKVLKEMMTYFLLTSHLVGTF